MLGLPWPRGPVLSGQGVMLRLPEKRDHAAWAALRAESEAELRPYEPRWSDTELTKAAFGARVKAAQRLAQDGVSFQFLVFDRRGEPLFGGVTLGQIRRGAAQSAQIGYWLGTRHHGAGHMSDAVVTVLRFAFHTLCLHRVEAACIAGNTKSIALLERCGFTHEGTARAYLEIDGHRRDHELYACLASDVGLGRSGGPPAARG
ncbi:MAG: GNAT family N-acetyltransferase [Rhizobiaceae bacterium]|jgi:ribosomal-protein-alanine N-acetyltransferase|nr:GNAT family N-acetyltransferase [Rhizobiaceae bacterium]